MRAVLQDDEVGALLGLLDLEQKVVLLSGATAWTTAEQPLVGLHPITLSDGPVGVRGAIFSEDRMQGSLFPCTSALAASWDEALVRRVAEALGHEAARQGVDVVLGPTINLHRSPLAGRHFECFSEDPLLTGRLAVAYVRGLQDMGVGACPKHYVANDAETDRRTVDNVLDERTLRELYLAPFERLVLQSDPWTLMCAYNGVNGAPMSENGLLSTPLRTEWGYGGVVVSDWGAVYRTEESASASLDLAMPGPTTKWGDHLVDAVRRAVVPEEEINAKVRRLLQLAARTRALTAPGADRSPAPAATDPRVHGPLARDVAIAGTVLLQNDGTLPLQRASLQRLALIGRGAHDPRPQGGGSATVFPPYVVTPAEALRDLLGEDVVVTAPGPAVENALRVPTADEVDSATLAWLGPDGETLARERVASTRAFRSYRTVHDGATSLELTASFVAGVDGLWRLGVSGVGSFELHLDGVDVLSSTAERDARDHRALLTTPPQDWVERVLTAGQVVEVRLRYQWAADFSLFQAGFYVDEPRGTDDEEITRAVDLATSSDVAVVFVGTSSTYESEGFDRTSLNLPGRQDELVSAVAAVNPRTIVVLEAGAPVEMPWREQVAAALLPWFAGMECGAALAQVLLGDAEPGGRLPTTWPHRLAEAPVSTTVPTDGRLVYDEGLHIGHRAYLRAGVEPAYWFGHGQGYTSWRYEALTASRSTAVVRVCNTGSRSGREVVQVYVSRPGSVLDRPALTLAGFTPITAEPGQTVDVEVALAPEAWRHWDVASSSWCVEPGSALVHAGPSAGHLPLTTSLLVAADT